ncbi:MAG TPA: biotin--[acetyl-CoA-carboxylase] ligase [Terriglobales bacterium]|nr:biotin--[acetyl-CoA-carboxylase] ligase [Terriglobales bacterium]
MLADHAMVVVSGTKLAAELGISRSAVWRFVQQLRGLGVQIAGHPATGYRLEAVPDLLLPEFIAPALRGTIFTGSIHHYFRLGSTNKAAMDAAAAGEPQGSVFLAEEQTAGRGRSGHDWYSEKSSGIYVSILLRPDVPPSDVLVLSLAAGLAVQNAVEQVTGVCPDLRWPNDLLLGSKKFCGMLTEMTAEPTRVRYVVLGIGLNANQESFPAALTEAATSLRMQTGRDWSRVELTVALLRALDHEFRMLLPQRPGMGTAPAEAAMTIIRRFEERSSYARGKRVHVEEAGGFDGVTTGLDDRGFLLVKARDGLRTVLSGGVREL